MSKDVVDDYAVETEFDMGMLDGLAEGEEETEDVVEEEDVEADEEEGGEEEEGEDEDGEEDSDDGEADDQRSFFKTMQEEVLALRRELSELKGKKEEPEAPPVDDNRPIDFITDDDHFNEVVSDRGKLNGLMNTVFQAGQAAMLQQLPAIVNRQVYKEFQNQQVSMDFYKANPDLRKVVPLVSAVSKELAAEWAGKDGVSQKMVLDEVAKRVRSRMGGGKKSKVVDAKERKRNPGAVRTSGARPGNGRPGRSGGMTIADEIAAMSKL